MAKKKKLDHLTRDVLEAEKAGMSYGQWKAQHPHTCYEDEAEPDPAPDATMRERTCAECGKKFYTRAQQANKLYCSDECRMKHSDREYKARRRIRAGSTAVCPICGTEYYVDHTGQMYCSRRCSALGNREKTAERARMAKEAATNGSN